MNRKTVTASIMAIAITLTGCQNDTTGADPTPITVPPTSTSTTPTPTPSTTATPTPTQQQLFTQAVAQYTRTEGEVTRVIKLGGLAPNEPPTQVLTATTTGKPLDEYTSSLRSYHDKQIVNVSGETLVHSPHLAPTAAGALITINICVDGSSMRNTIGPEKKPSRGVPQRTIASYKMVAGQLKMFLGTSEKDPSCAK